MLTARDDEFDKLLGLELGADDYLTKPFSPRELVARVQGRPASHGAAAGGTGDVIRAGEVVLDLPRMRAEVAGRTVDLTTTEFRLLATMAARPGRIFTRAQLLDAVRGVAFESYERAIDSHIKNLRRKVEPDPRRAALRPDRLWRRLPLRRRRELGAGWPDPGSPVSAGPGAGHRQARRTAAGAPATARAAHGTTPTGTAPTRSRADAPARPDRAATGRRTAPPWDRRRGFGCIFAAALPVRRRVARHGHRIVLSQLGPVPGRHRGGRGRRHRGRPRCADARSPRATLDRWSTATRRVEAGDYSVRVGHRRHSRPAARPASSTAASTRWPPRLRGRRAQRRTLLADISHELRTPLAVVQGNLEAIIDGVYPADPAHLAPILDETRVLGRLIDDLRTLALSEAGTLTLHPEPTDPGPADRRGRALVRRPSAAGGVRRGVVDRGRRAADPRRRPGAHPRGAVQPGRQRPPPHAGRRARDGRRRASNAGRRARR